MDEKPITLMGYPMVFSKDVPSPRGKITLIEGGTFKDWVNVLVPQGDVGMGDILDVPGNCHSVRVNGKRFGNLLKHLRCTVEGEVETSDDVNGPWVPAKEWVEA